MSISAKKHDLYGWHALKGQKLLAQGSALGIMAIGKAPCKGKSFMCCLDFLSFCPYRATDLRPKQPRALPWAKSFCPFRAYWVISTVQVKKASVDCNQ